MVENSIVDLGCDVHIVNGKVILFGIDLLDTADKESKDMERLYNFTKNVLYVSPGFKQKYGKHTVCELVPMGGVDENGLEKWYCNMFHIDELNHEAQDLIRRNCHEYA